MTTATTTVPKNLASRTVTNPIYNDAVTFLETNRESNGYHTLVEVVLAPKSGNPLHFHKDFSEEFTCVEGELSIQLGKEIIRLKPGETAVAPALSHHRFFNQTDKPCKFRCRIAPGCLGFEQMIQIGYGLARDGKVNAQGMPKNPFEMGYLMTVSGTCLIGWMSVLQPLLSWLGRQAVKKGIAADLQRRYMTIW